MHPSMQRIFDDVARFGWHVVAVSDSREGSIDYCFSVGLFETYDHPEIVVFGLPMNVAHRVIATCVELIEQGSPLQAGEVREDLLNRFSAAIVSVDHANYSEYLGSAIGFYDGTDFPALQIVWPDKENRFPWDPESDPKYVSSQVILNMSVS
jgi:hypothetical protein